MAERYLQTPKVVMELLELFQSKNLEYVLFKCDHIFEGQNKNVDILFRTMADYRAAGQLLAQQGFIVRLSEKIEKYKTMYTGLVEEKLYSIHLHREIAWHGMIALEKGEVFRRKKILAPLVVVPGLEDSILIHAAHVLFENKVIKKREQSYLSQFSQPGIDRQYIQRQLKQNHWNYGFQKVMNKMKEMKRNPSLSPSEQLRGWSGKLWREPATSAYVFWKALRKVFRPLDLRRKGCCIALIGVNGSGKSTLSRQVLQQLEPLTQHLGKEQHYYYFGWQPEFFLTRWISSRLKKKGKSIFRDLNFQQPKPSSSTGQRFRQELVFGYIFAEFLCRYLKYIYPQLRRGQLVICDRYFYDIYGQYPYAQKSPLLGALLRFFPAPNSTYVLDAEVEKLLSRDKTNRERAAIESTPRRALPKEYLEEQRKKYHTLAQSSHFPIIATAGEIQQCAAQIIRDNWRGLV